MPSLLTDITLYSAPNCSPRFLPIYLPIARFGAKSSPTPTHAKSKILEIIYTKIWVRKRVACSRIELVFDKIRNEWAEINLSSDVWIWVTRIRLHVTLQEKRFAIFCGYPQKQKRGIAKTEKAIQFRPFRTGRAPQDQPVVFMRPFCNNDGACLHVAFCALCMLCWVWCLRGDNSSEVPFLFSVGWFLMSNRPEGVEITLKKDLTRIIWGSRYTPKLRICFYIFHFLLFDFSVEQSWNKSWMWWPVRLQTLPRLK